MQLETENKPLKLFIYRKRELVREPLSDYLGNVLGSALGMIVTIIGQYESRISGLHLGKEEIATYHDNAFEPKAALVLGDKEVRVKRVSRIGKSRYQTYILPVVPDNHIVPVQSQIKPEDFVYQVGVRNFRHNQVTFGVIERTSRYLKTEVEDEIEIEVGSESGSGVFTGEGKLLGMTLGQIYPDVMIATSIDHLLLIS